MSINGIAAFAANMNYFTKKEETQKGQYIILTKILFLKETIMVVSLWTIHSCSQGPLGPQNWLVDISAFHMLWNLAFLEFFYIKKRRFSIFFINFFHNFFFSFVCELGIVPLKRQTANEITRRNYSQFDHLNNLHSIYFLKIFFVFF